MLINILRNKLKKLWLISFTDKPYKIRKFDDLFVLPVGEPVDTPECLSTVLSKENGGTVFYSPLNAPVSSNIKCRYIGKSERFKVSGIFKEPDRTIYSLSNACLLGSLGLIYDKERRSYIDESAKEWLINLKNSAYTNLIYFPPKIKLKGITISCLTNGADFGFYHFLFESLVKIHLYKSIIKNIDYILFNGPGTEWKLKWIKRTNIDINKIIWVGNSDHYECEQLLFTNKLINDQQINHWCVKSLKELLKIASDTIIPLNSHHIIWISRKGLKVREIEWEDELLSFFPSIERVDLSLLDDVQTINKMQAASHVIGPHGAGLSNVYLCSPGTKVLEIYPNGSPFQPCYFRLSSICNLQYSVKYVDFKNKENKETGLPAFKDLLTKFIC